MSELRQKVTAGIIKPITPGKYSTDLILLMQSLLQVTPSRRASLDKILASPAVQKRLTGAKLPALTPSDSHVIGTIKARLLLQVRGISQHCRAPGAQSRNVTETRPDVGWFSCVLLHGRSSDALRVSTALNERLCFSTEMNAFHSDVI